VKSFVWVLLFIFVPFTVALGASEFYGTSPHLARLLTRWVAKALPKDARELVEDQWYDDLRTRQEKGLRVSLVFLAAGFLFSAIRIRIDYRKKREGTKRLRTLLLANPPVRIAAGSLAIPATCALATQNLMMLNFSVLCAATLVLAELTYSWTRSTSRRNRETVEQHSRVYDQDETRAMVKELVRGQVTIHLDNTIIHRDLNPDNIIIFGKDDPDEEA
jgi:hypothetical protein